MKVRRQKEILSQFAGFPPKLSVQTLREVQRYLVRVHGIPLTLEFAEDLLTRDEDREYFCTLDSMCSKILPGPQLALLVCEKLLPTHYESQVWDNRTLEGSFFEILRKPGEPMSTTDISEVLKPKALKLFLLPPQAQAALVASMIVRGKHHQWCPALENMIRAYVQTLPSMFGEYTLNKAIHSEEEARRLFYFLPEEVEANTLYC